jgi:NAD(P)-dependent dehydrogenase (short-subunit alcohol dehydrogenase family)
MNELQDFAGKVGIVTGGTRGIGKAITQMLVARGAKVYVFARDAQAGQALEQELGRTLRLRRPISPRAIT